MCFGQLETGAGSAAKHVTDLEVARWVWAAAAAISLVLVTTVAGVVDNGNRAGFWGRRLSAKWWLLAEVDLFFL